MKFVELIWEPVPHRDHSLTLLSVRPLAGSIHRFRQWSNPTEEVRHIKGVKGAWKEETQEANPLTAKKLKTSSFFFRNQTGLGNRRRQVMLSPAPSPCHLSSKGAKLNSILLRRQIGNKN